MNGQLSIERLNATYLVPRELPDVHSARARLDGAMQRRLAGMCEQLLAGLLDTGDVSVWFIRRLDLDLAVDVGGTDEDGITRAWASRIATSLARTIARGPDGDAVMRFPDRAAYLAHFVRDMAEGCAWNKWYYDQLDTLRSLPISAAIREAFLREPGEAENVLRQLVRRGWLEETLAVMDEGDVFRVFESCGDDHASMTESEDKLLVSLLASVWNAASIRSSPTGLASASNSLRLYLALRLKSPNVRMGASIRHVIIQLLGFAEILRRARPPERLLSALIRGKLAEAIEVARASGIGLYLESLPYIQNVAAGDREWLASVAQVLNANLPTALSQEKESTARTISSSFTGLFLLLPSMLALDLARIIGSGLYGEEIKNEETLRYLLFLKCLGRERCAQAAYDFVPRFLSGSEELPNVDDVREFTRAATAEINRACVWLLLEELVRMGRTDGRCLAADLVSSDEDQTASVLLVRDITNDVWLHAVFVHKNADETSAALESSLATIRHATGNAAACLLVEEDLAASGAVRITDEIAQHVVTTANPSETPDEFKETISRYLTRRRPVAPDLTYFSLLDSPNAIIADAGFDLTWSLVARAMMKEFAMRLINFGWSSADYIYSNFLKSTGTVKIEGGQVEASLSRVPLQIMLRIAGLDAQTYTLSWLNDTQVTLSLMPE